MNRLLIRLILFIALFVWCVGFSYNSLFPNSAYTIIASPFLKKLYGTVCHQHIEKTFLFNKHYFYVCARCTGIYSGALVVSFISIFSLPRLPEKMTLLYFSAIPMLIDVLSTTTGIFFGSATFAYILAAIENNFADKSL